MWEQKPAPGALSFLLGRVGSTATYRLWWILSQLVHAVSLTEQSAHPTSWLEPRALTGTVLLVDLVNRVLQYPVEQNLL